MARTRKKLRENNYKAVSVSVYDKSLRSIFTRIKVFNKKNTFKEEYKKYLNYQIMDTDYGIKLLEGETLIIHYGDIYHTIGIQTLPCDREIIDLVLNQLKEENEEAFNNVINIKPWDYQGN